MRLPVYFALTLCSSLPQHRLLFFFFCFSLRRERNETVIPRRTWPIRRENVGSRSVFEKTSCSVNDLDSTFIPIFITRKLSFFLLSSAELKNRWIETMNTVETEKTLRKERFHRVGNEYERRVLALGTTRY